MWFRWIGAVGVAACHSAPVPEPAPPPSVVLAPAVVASAAPPSTEVGAPQPAAPVEVAEREPAPSAEPAEPPPPPAKGMKLSKDVRLRQRTTTVTGRLPPEVVQRIVRQSFGRVRLCVEKAVARPRLEITMTFTIDRAGAVAPGAKVDALPLDSKLSGCVAKMVAGLAFPQPESGTVDVVFPILATREEVTATRSGKSSKGRVWGDRIGDAFGAGGLGLSGVGEGGGGRGEGIGLGTSK